ncbi:MAG: hypothetical protein H8E78_08165 [Proteobacteria bacterium]|nr:hypothetical protein [Pseudomonadota bacterium]
MIVQSGISEAKLTVALDIRYPQAYLGLPPAIEFARDRDVAINWLPLSASSLKAPSTPDPSDDRGSRHRRFRADRVAREIEIYAESQGLVLNDYYRTGSSAAFHLAWLWMRHRVPEQLEDFLCEGFRAYWACEFDPASEAEAAALLSRFDDAFDAADGSYSSWCAGEGSAALDRISEDLQAHGAFAAPSYLVENEIFLGRQHLPMIDWILGGRNGRGPI